MNRKRGFTLTEILLAVMIVGLIGVALASLTTAASRESTIGNSRVLLRNNLSIAMRQLRKDVHDASRILQVQGPMAELPAGTVPLLVLASNSSLNGKDIVDDTTEDDEPDNDDQQYIAYCFTPGEVVTLASGSPVQPDEEGNSRDGGVIERVFWSGQALPTGNYCDVPGEGSDLTQTRTVWLRNVKFISSNYTYGDSASTYPVPLFELKDYTNEAVDELSKGAVLTVKLITELPTNPVVNEVIEEQILVTNGGGVFPPEP